MGLHMFKVYSAGISLHFLKGKKKKKNLKKTGGGHCAFPHYSAVCPCHSGTTAVNVTDQSRAE